MTDGVIYVAKGAVYLDLAERSAWGLRGANPTLAGDLYTDQAVTPALFDQVDPILDGPTPKLACIAGPRFDRTACLDCDTPMLTSSTDLFHMPGRYGPANAMSYAARQAADVREIAA